MNELTGQVVFITGASSGIGRACAHAFAKKGAQLLLCARRADRLKELKAELENQYSVKVHTFNLDVRNLKNVQETLSQLPEAWQKIQILVNNAGLAVGLEKIHEGDIEDWERMIDTNIKGLLYVTRTVLPGMLERGQGHIINVGSIAGYETYPNGAVYCGTKAAVQAINTGLKMDLLGTPIRVTSVAPGLVETEFSEVRFKNDSARAASVYKGLQSLSPEDVADAILYCACCPPHVNIRELVIMPTAQSSAIHVHRVIK